MAVCRKLDSMRQSACRILHKLHCAFRVTRSDKPGNYQLCVCVDSEPQPNVAKAHGLSSFGRVLGLAVDEGPDLVGLNPTASQTAERSIKELLAHVADFNEQAEDRSFGKSG